MVILHLFRMKKLSCKISGQLTKNQWLNSGYPPSNQTTTSFHRIPRSQTSRSPHPQAIDASRCRKCLVSARMNEWTRSKLSYAVAHSNRTWGKFILNKAFHIRVPYNLWLLPYNPSYLAFTSSGNSLFHKQYTFGHVIFAPSQYR